MMSFILSSPYTKTLPMLAAAAARTCSGVPGRAILVILAEIAM
jgi:hypothetical protein